MRRISAYLIFSFVFLGLQASTRAQDILVPAGTLLHCTLNEPDLSSATTSVGDPVICHLSSLQEFGHVVFPRGSYLGGHLEADKEPGHFFGKGNLKLTFDRVGLPNTDIPVPAKVIAARGYRVNRQGEIVGHGHAKRDTIEWLITGHRPLTGCSRPTELYLTTARSHPTDRHPLTSRSHSMDQAARSHESATRLRALRQRMTSQASRSRCIRSHLQRNRTPRAQATLRV